MRRFVLLALTGLLAALATPALAAPIKYPRFNVDLAAGKVMPEGQRDDMDDHAAVRLDMKTGQFFTFTGALTRTSITRAVVTTEEVALPEFGHGRKTSPTMLVETEKDRNGYDYQLQVGFEGHIFGRKRFDPYFAIGVGAHRIDVADDTDGYASWHAGAGLDLHMGRHGDIGMAFQALLARPFDQDDGEEYVEATVGLILGG